MTSPYQTVVAGRGARLQGAVPTRRKPASPNNPMGLLLRGVVMSTYVSDDPSHPHAVDTDSGPKAVYCDVMCYTSVAGHRFFLVRGALVTQERSGLHDGDIWKPRPTTKDITGAAYDPEVGGNPYNLDGDHVLVGFLDGAFNSPVVLRAIPHPQQDVGNSETDPGRKLVQVQADGDPRLLRHHGASFGITDAGDFLVDLEKANDGTTDANGVPTPPADDGTAGNYEVKLQPGAIVTITMGGDAVLTIEESVGNAKLTLGDGAKSALIGEAVQTAYDQFVNLFNAHIHPTPTGPAGVTPTPASPLPATALSTKVKIPNG